MQEVFSEDTLFSPLFAVAIYPAASSIYCLYILHQVGWIINYYSVQTTKVQSVQ